MNRTVIYKGNTRIITTELIEIFHDSYVVDESGCHIWKGGIDSEGYGFIGYGGIRWRAHVLAHFIYNTDEITKDNPNVLHSCDIPPCVWGLHLRAGTSWDNVRDREERGRGAKGETHGMWGNGHKISGEKHGMYGNGRLVAGERNGRRTKPECTARGEKHGMYIPGPITEKKPKGYRLTEVDVRLIRKLKADGHGPAYIVRATGLGYQAVEGAYYGRTWKHLL